MKQEMVGKNERQPQPNSELAMRKKKKPVLLHRRTALCKRDQQLWAAIMGCLVPWSEVWMARASFKVRGLGNVAERGPGRRMHSHNSGSRASSQRLSATD